MTTPAAYVRLKQELVRDLRAIDGLLAELTQKKAVACVPHDVVFLGYVAVTLHQIYTGLETCFERISRTTEESLPVGPDTHRALLRDMALDLHNVRPAVLRVATAEALLPLLRFRHFVRHSYAVAWDAERLSAMVSQVQMAWPNVLQDMRQFTVFLDAASGLGP